jgi:hypothetical protein
MIPPGCSLVRPNASFGVFSGNPTRLGYGGWYGNAEQVATINVDNEFTNFDEPMAETAIGWKGITVAPVYSHGNFELRGEYSYIEYNTKAGARPMPGRDSTWIGPCPHDTRCTPRIDPPWRDPCQGGLSAG